MDSLTPMALNNPAMQNIFDAQDALLASGSGVSGPTFVCAVRGAEYGEPLADLMPEQAANLLYAMTGAGEHTRVLLTYALRGMGLRIMPAPDEPAAPAPTAQQDRRPLSVRERQILNMLRQGASNKDIAIQAGCTESTVKVHLISLYRKLGVRNRTQAALWSEGVGHAD